MSKNSKRKRDKYGRFIKSNLTLAEIESQEKGYVHPFQGKPHTEEHKKKISEVNSGVNAPFYGKKHTEETKRKISEANSGEKNPNYGKHCSEETKKKLSDALSGEKNPMYGKRGKETGFFGKHLSEEHKKRISKANTGKKCSKETRRRIGETSKGRKHSEEAKRKMSKSLRGENHPLYGKQHSEESKKKMSKSHKGKKLSEETKEKIKRKYLDPIFLANFQKAHRIKPNKKEKLLTDLLNEILPAEYKYVGDYSFWLAGKNPDFMNINGQKKLIELFGEYWHYTKLKKKNPEVTKKNLEQERINHFKTYGFSTLIIWENELKNPEKLSEKILEFHEKS